MFLFQSNGTSLHRKRSGLRVKRICKFNAAERQLLRKSYISNMSTAGLPPGVPLNNDDLGPQIIAATWTLTSISALFLFMRVYAKLWTQRGLWTDDYILIVAWVSMSLPLALSPGVSISH